MKKVAVVLSGCGNMDGSEIHESVLTLLAIDRMGAQYQCLAPNIDQYHVINHATKEVNEGEKRNVLQEAARIARGDILDLAQAKAQDYDALIFPGGLGVAKNLCDFAFKGMDLKVLPVVKSFIESMYKKGKPTGFICIAPVMIPKLFPKGVQLTIGKDLETANAINTMGGKHVNCKVTDMVVDLEHKVVTTPAYMLGKRIIEVQAGIEKLVAEVLELA